MLSTGDRQVGFTLIELLVSITILGILMAAVSAAMMVGLGTNASTGTRIDQSRDEQFIAAYLSADAHGATTIKGSGTTPTCTFPGGGWRVVVEFVGEDFSEEAEPTVTKRTVSYLIPAAPVGRPGELHRLVCIGGAVNPAPGGDTTLARQVTSGSSSCVNDPCSVVQVKLRSGDLAYTLTGRKRTT